jgi:hypothetical protein
VTIAAPQTAPIRLGIAARQGERMRAVQPGERMRAVPARPVRASAAVSRALFLLGLGLVMLLVQVVIGIALVVSFAIAAGREATRRIRSLRAPAPATGEARLRR